MAWAYHPEERASIFSAQLSQVASRAVQEDLEKAQAALVEEKEGCNRPYTEDGLRRKEIPLFRMGVIAGVRHCEGAQDGRTDRGRDLYYANAVSHASTVSSTWANQGIRCALNLGNLIDRRAGERSRASLQAIRVPLCDPLKTQSWRWRIQDNHQVNDFQGEVVHIKGPHDLEYLTVEQIDTVLPKSRFSTAARCYFSVSPCKGWVMVFLDTYDLNLMSNQMEARVRARDILETMRKKRDREYSTECGAVGSDQLIWLRNVIESARVEGQHCIVFSHSALEPKIADRGRKDLLCWNWQEVQDAMHSAPGVVACCVSGQQEDDTHAIRDRSNRKQGVIEHVSIGNAILSKPGKFTYSVVELHEEKVFVQGFGDNASHTISCKPIQQVAQPSP